MDAEQRGIGPAEGAGRAPVAPESRGLGVFLLVAAAVGGFASFMVTVDKLRFLESPDFSPACDVSATVSCTDVMLSWQAEALGFPNSLLGLIGFGMLAAVGAAMLAGARFAPWFWFLMVLGATLAVIAVHWFVWESVMVIGALCLYCMAVWTVTVPSFVLLAARAAAAFGPPSGWVRALFRLRMPVAVIWTAALLGLTLAELARAGGA